MSDAIDPAHVENASRARALYLESLRPDMSRADWHATVREARKLVAMALRVSRYLKDIAGALELNCGHGLVFRHLLAPPVSQDQFSLLCESWSKSAENGSKRIKRPVAKAAEAVILARLDPGRVKWLRTGRAPTRLEISTLLTVVATLIAQQRMATAGRTALALEQESAVVTLLEGAGWTKLPSKAIDERAQVPPRHFMRKTRFAAGPKAHQEVDIACGLPSGYVLAMECKVTNDVTNSVKRLNDVIKKAVAWKVQWGRTVITAALLQGVVSPKDVQRLSEHQIEVFWSHDLAAFLAWLVARETTS